ncbi:MAG: hypothetical protein KF851_17220 [Pirellulaceae bacterium]|nr:hypothetical protein [Pirellulaceae bacterium]
MRTYWPSPDFLETIRCLDRESKVNATNGVRENSLNIVAIDLALVAGQQGKKRRNESHRLGNL